MIERNTFVKAVNNFNKLEKRTNFIELSQKLIRDGYDVEGCILLLATWNFARFRYAVKQFDINQFKQSLGSLQKSFKILQGQKIETVNLNKYGNDIKYIFDTLSSIKGIEFTDAPKIMYLLNPKLFVMWDDYIRGSKPKKYYDSLDIVKNKEWAIEKYKKDSGDYLRFLKDMQCRFSHLRLPLKSNTMAKAIDEFNYVKITLPIQEAMNRRVK